MWINCFRTIHLFTPLVWMHLNEAKSADILLLYSNCCYCHWYCRRIIAIIEGNCWSVAAVVLRNSCWYFQRFFHRKWKTFHKCSSRLLLLNLLLLLFNFLFCIVACCKRLLWFLAKQKVVKSKIKHLLIFSLQHEFLWSMKIGYFFTNRKHNSIDLHLYW